MIKILIAEQDAEMRSSLREYLKLEGYEAAEAESGEAALRIWQQEEPGLLLLDAGISEPSGLEVLKTIRKKSWAVPVLMISNQGEEELSAFEEGTDDYVVMPFSMEVLIKRIQALLRRSSAEAEEKFELGSLQIDHAAYQVLWNKKPIELTAKELELLWSLVQKKGKVLTRSQLLDEIWGYDYIGDERVVDAHIKNLRRKLPVDLVRTVKGRGYTLAEEACQNE